MRRAPGEGQLRPGRAWAALLSVAVTLSCAAAVAAEKGGAALEAGPVADPERLRAFYTAPPAIPHVVTSMGSGECATCHGDVRELGERSTVETPHPELRNCSQCHVGVQSLNEGLEVAQVVNSWRGLEFPGEGRRAHDWAPPVVPHRFFFRENCNSCHGSDNARVAMRGPHPERSSCLQCHAFDMGAEF